LDKSIHELGQDLARSSYAETTVTRYCAVAQSLCTRLGKPVSEVTRDELRGFVDELMAREVSSSTKRNDLAGLLFLYRKTLGKPEMVSFIKLPKRYSALPVVLSKDEVNRLLNAIRRPRIQALAMVMYGAGLRVSEAIALETSDIDGARGVIRVRHGKGNKAREAKLSPVLLKWLRDYWSTTRPPKPYLFANAQGELPVEATVRKALICAGRDAKINKRITPHVLRHCFATHLLEEGTDVHVVGTLLGHASIRTTARYARVTEKIVRQTPSPLDLLPPRR
jgi:integrase/recombinase XerD